MLRANQLSAPPVDLPPPLDARRITTWLARTPRPAVAQPTVILRAPSIVRRLIVGALRVIVRVYRCWPRSERPPLAVSGARPPPEGGDV